MKWTTATAFVLVLSVGGAGAAFVLARTPKTPGEVLAEVRGEMGSSLFDESAALRRLDRAVGEAKSHSDPTVAVELLKTRSEIYRDLGTYDRARSDIEDLLATYRRGDRELELELARLESADGELAAALQRARGLVQREPEFAAAWEFVGSLEDTVGSTALASTFDSFDFSLAREDAELAKALLSEFAARDADDPVVANLRFRLGELFVAANEVDLYDALAVIAEPRAAFARSRQAYARSIELEPSVSRVVALSHSFESAGQLGRAITLEHAAKSVESFARDAAALASLLDNLADADRVAEARSSLRAWSWQTGGTLEFFRSAGQILYESGDFGGLRPIATGLRRLGGDTGVYWAGFYGSLPPIASARASASNERLANALRQSIERLRQFALEDDYAEPFYGARTDAWFLIAEAHQHLAQYDQERAALQRGLGLRPRHSSEAWVRLAETIKDRPPVAWKQVEAALTEALDLAPERTSEIREDWLEAGRMTVRTMGLSMDDLIDELARDQAAVPVIRKVGPAVLTLIAQAHLENRNGFAAMRAAKRARREHPGIIPPLDVIIGAKLLEPNRYDVERDIVARIEAAGIDAHVESFLEQLPAGRLQGDALVRAIRAAPARFGKPAVARWYQQNGDAARAGEALAGLDPNMAPPSLRLLRARTLLDEGRHEDAIEVLTAITGTDRVGQEAVVLLASAYVAAESLEELDPLVRRLAAMKTSPDLLLEMADILMAARRLDLALAIVDSLDVRPETRTADFYRRRIMVDILLAGKRGPEPALESILRSEAYLRDGTPELASILFAVSRRQWTDLPELVALLRASRFRPSPQQEVALYLLEERLEAGRRAAVAGLEAAPRDPAWAFLSVAAASLVDDEIVLPAWFGPRAADDASRLLRGKNRRTSRDPRESLVIFLLSDVPGWSPWLKPLVERIGRITNSPIWSSWLSIRIDTARGDDEAVRKTVERLVEKQRGFGPGHDMAVQFAEEAFPTEPLHPIVVRARRMRLQSLGAELIDDPVEVAIAEASELARRGKTTEAVQTLQSVLTDAGDGATEARLILGILMIRAKQPSFAATFLFDAAMADPGVFETVVVDSLLFSLRYALRSEADGVPQRGALGRERALEMLDALVTRYPLDPIVALNRLEFMDVAEGERGARARGILERLHDRADGKTLESLRPGSTRAWVELLAPIAVDVAYDLVARDLALEPGSLELWQLSGIVAEARGDEAEARKAYETLLAIDPRAETGYALATLLIEQGEPAAQLENVLRTADRAQGGGSIRSTYLRALAEMRKPRPNADSVVNRLGTLWTARERMSRELDPLEVGLLYTDALFRRQGPDDLDTLAQVLGELRPLAESDPYAIHLVAALEGLRRECVADAAKAARTASPSPSDG